MPKRWTDTEFEIVSGPYRVGDPHPTRRRWVYAGVDPFGRPVWYRPPRLNRWQFILAAVIAIPLIRAAIYGVAEMFAHH